MKYKIRAIKNGECQVRDYITYSDHWSEETSTFNLYIWLIEGGEKPIIVDTGPKDVAGFNAGTAAYIPGGVIQTKEEETPELIRLTGYDPKDIGHVFLTHLHGDHYTYFSLFENAQMVVNRRGFLSALQGIPRDIMQTLAKNWPNSLRLVEDEEVLPGIRTFWLGAHSDCSQGIAVETEKGTVVLSGDVAYMFKNLEEDIPIRAEDIESCHNALIRLRSEGDIILPGHDPLILERFPGGVIA